MYEALGAMLPSLALCAQTHTGMHKKEREMNESLGFLETHT